MKEIPSLCQGFNGVDVKKGETFKIELLEGGAPGTKYEIISANATLIEKDKKYVGGHQTERTFTFRADEAGNVEVKAQATMSHFGNRKVKPISFTLRVQ